MSTASEDREKMGACAHIKDKKNESFYRGKGAGSQGPSDNRKRLKVIDYFQTRGCNTRKWKSKKTITDTSWKL